MSVCPHCGFSLDREAAISLGALDIDADGLEFRWRGQTVKLTPTERCIVRSLAAAKGHALSAYAIVGAGGFEDIEYPMGQVRVYAHRIRRRFGMVDPEFSALKTVWGFGLRWAA